MSTTNVILREKIEGLGFEADVVTVKRGYARNFLIPEGKAYEATRSNLRHIERLKEARARREAEEYEKAEQTAARIRKVKLSLELATGQGGKAFGSITVNDILEALQKRAKVEIDKRTIELEKPIKTLGEFEVPVRLHSEIVVNVPLKVKSPEEEKPAEEGR